MIVNHASKSFTSKEASISALFYLAITKKNPCCVLKVFLPELTIGPQPQLTFFVGNVAPKVQFLVSAVIPIMQMFLDSNGGCCTFDPFITLLKRNTLPLSGLETSDLEYQSELHVYLR